MFLRVPLHYIYADKTHTIITVSATTAEKIYYTGLL